MADRFKELNCFLAVERFGNFTRAAEALGISQPSLSAIISAFEEDLGLSLFDRTTRSVELTEAGGRLLPRAKQIVSDLDEVVTGLRDTATLASGSVTVAALPSVCSRVLPKALECFRRSYPNVQVRFIETLAGPMAELVMTGECEFAIGIDTPQEADLRFSVIHSEEMLMICSQDHRFAGSDSLPWSCLSGEPFVSMGSMTSIHEVIRSISVDHEVSLNIVHTALFLATAFGLVREGLGVSVMPRSLLEDFNMDGIAAVPLHSPQAKRQLGVLQRKTRALSPAAVELSNAVKQIFARKDAEYDR